MNACTHYTDGNTLAKFTYEPGSILYSVYAINKNTIFLSTLVWANSEDHVKEILLEAYKFYLECRSKYVKYKLDYAVSQRFWCTRDHDGVTLTGLSLAKSVLKHTQLNSSYGWYGVNKRKQLRQCLLGKKTSVELTIKPVDKTILPWVDSHYSSQI